MGAEPEIRWYEYKGSHPMSVAEVERMTTEAIEECKRQQGRRVSIACGDRAVSATYMYEDGVIRVEVSQPVRVGWLDWMPK